jgi:5'-3' exoribonuclease 2
MNQQRARRFRSVQEAEEEAEKKAEFQKILADGGRAAADAEPSAPKFDSNVITPGTPFMHFLSVSLKYWVAYKISTDPAWAKLKVVISDASVPGEGEHKMMEFIRSQRRSQEHDPNTRHVIYGLDADLIMLSLATHEPHFRILREDIWHQEGNARKCHICGQTGHLAAECTGQAKEKQDDLDIKEKGISKKPYVYLNIVVLREYLEAELYVPNLPFHFDLERAIDDYVFLCFFVGNDFLPHLPSLSIKEEGIDTLVAVWKDNLALMGGYVTTDGVVDLEKAQHILDGLAVQEDAIFKRRRQIDLKREAGAKRRKLDQERRNGPNNGSNMPSRNGSLNRQNSRRGKREENFDDVIVFAPGAANSNAVRQQAADIYANRKEIFQAQVDTVNVSNKSAAAMLKETLLRRKSSVSQTNVADNENGNAESTPDTPQSVLGKRKSEAVEDQDDAEEGTPGRNTPIPKVENSDEMPPDDVRLWEDGYADRYYERKFGADPKDLAFRQKVGIDYIEGVCWVLLYYMQGCPSWTWFYPHHYAPFAADFKDMAKVKLNFEKGKPFKPYEQLMGVLPAASNHAIPEPFRSLMSDPDSPIIDFYPTDFGLDLNGKKFKWQGVVLLPFIDEKRLLDAMATRYPLLSEEEVERNERGNEILYFSVDHPLYQDTTAKFYSKKEAEPTFKLDPRNSNGLTGKVEKIDSLIPQGPLNSPLEESGMPSLSEDRSMRYAHFQFTLNH